MLATFKAVLIGGFVALAMMSSLSTFISPAWHDQRRDVVDNAGARIQTADDAGGPVQAA